MTTKSRSKRGQWDVIKSTPEEKSIRRHKEKEEKQAAYEDKNSWVAVGNDEWEEEEDRRERQSEKDKRSYDYRHSGYDNPGIGYWRKHKKLKAMNKLAEIDRMVSKAHKSGII